MTAPGNNMLQIVLALAFVIASGYAAGRIHQWYKHGLERDHAYRDGYDQASRCMFDMAISSRAGRAPATAAAAAGVRVGVAVQPQAQLHRPPAPRAAGTTLAFPDPAGHGRAVGSSRRRIVAQDGAEAGRRGRRPAA
jgi:hypothetical protein